jgi:hypothetical protein
VAVAALLGVALIVFIVQNTQKVQIKFFGASGHRLFDLALDPLDDTPSRPVRGPCPLSCQPSWSPFIVA